VPASHAPVIPQFLKQALGGGSLIVFGDGNQTRDFVYIDDVVDALFAAATASDVDRRIINVGSGRGVSINQLVEKVARATGREVSSLYSQADNGGVSRLVADVSLARRKLDYSPEVGLDEGLELMLTLDRQFQVASDQ
jgi:UDP-glucose 4-epimerase